MPIRNVVIGQKVTAVKVQRARELRQQMTAAETLLWERLRTNRLGGFHFRRQQVIDGLIADFYCHTASLVVEVDGGVHQQQANYDTERDRVLAARGLRVLRVSNEEVNQDTEAVLARILLACRESC